MLDPRCRVTSRLAAISKAMNAALMRNESRARSRSFGFGAAGASAMAGASSAIESRLAWISRTTATPARSSVAACPASIR